MTKAQHTPGPWKLHVGEDYIDIQGADDEPIIIEML